MRGSGSARAVRAIVAATAVLVTMSSAIESRAVIGAIPKFRRDNFHDKIGDI